MIWLVWLFFDLAPASASRSLDVYTLGNYTQDLLPECAQNCQSEILPWYSCDVGPTSNSTVECYCSGSSPAYDALRSCIQSACDLEDTLHWQKTRAQTCGHKPRDVRYAILVTCCVLFGVTSIFCVGRLMSRSQYLGGPGYWWDDWVVLFLYTLSIEMVVDVVSQHKYHAGVDVIGATTEDIHGVLLWCYLSEPFYLFGTFGGKLVFALLYLRMWKTPGILRLISWCAVVLATAGMVCFSLASALVRWPWWYYYPGSTIVRNWVAHTGINIPAAVYAFSALNIWGDFYVLLLPIPMVYQLRGLPLRRKLSILSVFLLGFLATAASCVRIATIPPLVDSINVTWDFGLFMLACQVELHVSMICINMPSWTGLVRRTHQRYRDGRRSPGGPDTTTVDQEASNAPLTLTAPSRIDRDESEKRETPTSPLEVA